MATDLFRYDLLIQDALRGVVRKVMAQAARDGLPGDHHFQITFRTDTPGLRLSSAMRKRYPSEMTIILQHRFYDLAVTDHAFEVGLTFNEIPERLLVPFDAVTGFFDPSVEFGLKFEVSEPSAESGSNDTAPPKKTPSLLPSPVIGKVESPIRLAGKSESKPKPDGRSDLKPEPKPAAKPDASVRTLSRRTDAPGHASAKAPAPKLAEKPGAEPPRPEASKSDSSKSDASKSDTSKSDSPKSDAPKPEAKDVARKDGDANVVSIDSFRRK